MQIADCFSYADCRLIFICRQDIAEGSEENWVRTDRKWVGYKRSMGTKRVNTEVTSLSRRRSQGSPCFQRFVQEDLDVSYASLHTFSKQFSTYLLNEVMQPTLTVNPIVDSRECRFLTILLQLRYLSVSALSVLKACPSDFSVHVSAITVPS